MWAYTDEEAGWLTTRGRRPTTRSGGTGNANDNDPGGAQREAQLGFPGFISGPGFTPRDDEQNRTA